MTRKKEIPNKGHQTTRREFIKLTGLSVASFLAPATGLPLGLSDLSLPGGNDYNTKVAVTRADQYERTYIRQKVEHLFDSLGGISDVVKPGDKVAIKINLTGGSYWADHPKLNGVDVRECMWNHPETLRAVGELIIDCGVTPSDIYIVEALWDQSCYTDYGYQEIQQYLGAQLVNLNTAAPYTTFGNISTGGNAYFYNSFILNQILGEVNVFVSLPKMKQHIVAGMTHSMKNLVGCVPLQFYQMPGNTGTRSKIHEEGGEPTYHLPRSICDLNMARPVHLTVIDGIKNAIGGEGAWAPAFEPCQHHWLLAGKDPVAADSIATKVMGQDPEAMQLELPDGGSTDNYLYLAHQKGMGTNQLNEIEIVGDGSGEIFGIGDDLMNLSRVRLYQNHPNPFSESTMIRFFLPDPQPVRIRIHDNSGREVVRLLDGRISSGEHQIEWRAGGLPGGIYHCTLQAGGISLARKMIYRSF
jgi:uncharacterized protein (DUF362 family)